MVSEANFFRRKQPNQHIEISPDAQTAAWSLRYQLRRATQYASNGAEPLAPPSRATEEIMTADEPTLKDKYPKRYGIYQQAISRAKRREPFELQDQLENTHWLHIANSLDRYIGRHDTLPLEQRTLHEPQMAAFRDLSEFLEQGNMSGYFELPTGFGKTVLFSTILKALNTPVEHYVSRDMRSALRTRALIVVPSLQLVTQTLDRLGKFAPGLDMGSISSLRKPKEGLHATVITYDSFRSRIESGRLQPSDYDVVILDEAHKLLSERRIDAFEQFREHCLVLGFTATPGYDEEKHIKHHLGDRIHRVSLKEAVDMKMLCNFQAYTYNTGIDLSQVQRTRQGEYIEESLEKTVDYQARAEIALELYKENFDGLQGYLFCEGVTAAKITAKVFSAGGVPCEAVTEETPKKEREEIWKRFESGSTKLLSNVDLFTQGTDHAEASLVMNLNETESIVKEQQRDGRALRTSEIIKDKVAHVVNFLYRDNRRRTVTFAQIAETDSIELLQSRIPQPAANRDSREHTEDTDESEASLDLVDLDLDEVVTHNDLVEQVSVSASSDTGVRDDLGEPEETDEQIKLRDKQQQHFEIQTRLFETLSDMDDMYTVVERAIDGEFMYHLIEKEQIQRESSNPKIADVYRTDIDRMFEIKEQMTPDINSAYDIASPFVIEIQDPEQLEDLLTRGESAIGTVQRIHSEIAEMFDEALDIGMYYDTDLLDLL